MASSTPENELIPSDMAAAASEPQLAAAPDEPIAAMAEDSKTTSRRRSRPVAPAKPAVKAKSEKAASTRKSRSIPTPTRAKAAVEIAAPKKAAGKPATPVKKATTVKKSPKPVADKKKVAARPAAAEQKSSVKLAPKPQVPSPQSAKKASAGSSKKSQVPKAKLVRDSFTMPKEDYSLIGLLKDRALGFKRPAKKSELLRAGLHVLQALAAPALRAALDALTPLKTGRPRKDAS
jgi:hypothetical protein